jgi:hypothetical protein
VSTTYLDEKALQRSNKRRAGLGLAERLHVETTPATVTTSDVVSVLTSYHLVYAHVLFLCFVLFARLLDRVCCVCPPLTNVASVICHVTAA